MNSIEALTLVKITLQKGLVDSLKEKERLEKLECKSLREDMVKMSELSYEDGAIDVINRTVELIDELIETESKQ